MFIWRASDTSRAEVRVSLEKGAGWFTLSARASDGSLTEIQRNEADLDAHGAMKFMVTPDDTTKFLLQIKCAYTTGGDAKVNLEVRQHGGMLVCEDASGNTLNDLKPDDGVVIGKMAANTAKTFDFRVWS